MQCGQIADEVERLKLEISQITALKDILIVYNLRQ